ELAPRRDRRNRRARCPRHPPGRSSRLALVHPPPRAGQYHHHSAAAEVPRAQPGRERLAVRARQLALQPHLQILRRSRRPLLCGMEQARRSALAHHVHRTMPMGPRVLINGIWYYALYTIGRALHEITDRSIPPAVVSLELAQRTERILAVGPTLLGVSSANELAGESFALDREFKEAAQLVSELSNTGLAETELNEIQTAFAQVTANFTELKAVTQKRIASADRKVKLLRQIFESYNQFRLIWTPRFEDLQRQILLLRNTLDTARNSTEERRAALDRLNSALRGLVPLEQIQQDVARSFELLLRAANANTRASLKTIRDQLTELV